jgi:hypothetical protein
MLAFQLDSGHHAILLPNPKNGTHFLDLSPTGDISIEGIESQHKILFVLGPDLEKMFAEIATSQVAEQRAKLGEEPVSVPKEVYQKQTDRAKGLR